jgi:hypothetical protein
MKFSFLLKVVIAFCLSGLFWNFSQYLIVLAVEQFFEPVPPSDNLTTGPLAVEITVSNVLSGLGGALIAFAILFLMLPKCSSSALARIIAIFACLSVLFSVAFNYCPILSGGRSPGILLVAEIGGAIAGASLAFFSIRFKSEKWRKRGQVT